MHSSLKYFVTYLFIVYSLITTCFKWVCKASFDGFLNKCLKIDFMINLLTGKLVLKSPQHIEKSVKNLIESPQVIFEKLPNLLEKTTILTSNMLKSPQIFLFFESGNPVRVATPPQKYSNLLKLKKSPQNSSKLL